MAIWYDAVTPLWWQQSVCDASRVVDRAVNLRARWASCSKHPQACSGICDKCVQAPARSTHSYIKMMFFLRATSHSSERSLTASEFEETPQVSVVGLDISARLLRRPQHTEHLSQRSTQRCRRWLRALLPVRLQNVFLQSAMYAEHSRVFYIV